MLLLSERVAIKTKIRVFPFDFIRVIRGSISPNDSALALLDELDEFDDLFGLG